MWALICFFLQESRPGGSITPVVMARLRRLMKGEGAGRVRIVEGAEVQVRACLGRGWWQRLRVGEGVFSPTGTQACTHTRLRERTTARI